VKRREHISVLGGVDTRRSGPGHLKEDLARRRGPRRQGIHHRSAASRSALPLGADRAQCLFVHSINLTARIEGAADAD